MCFKIKLVSILDKYPKLKQSSLYWTSLKITPRHLNKFGRTVKLIYIVFYDKFFIDILKLG